MAYKGNTIENVELFTGKGLKIKKTKPYKKQLLFGKGYETKTKNLIQINKFYIDVDCLNNGILKLKYVKNINVCNKVPITYNLNVKQIQIIKDLCENTTFNKKLYDTLTQTEKQVIINFCDACHIDCNISTDNKKEVEKMLNIYYGEIQAGNKSNVENYKKMVKLALDKNYISSKIALQLINNLI